MAMSGDGWAVGVLGRRNRPGLGLSLVAGAVVAVLVGAAGLLFVATRPTTWSATASAVVLPSRNIERDAIPGYFETLSRGQIVNTFAEVLRLQRFQASAAGRLGLSPAERNGVDVAIQVVPDTAILTVTATAPRPEVAQSMADNVLAEAGSYIESLSQPYELSTVSGAEGTAERGGPPKATLAAAVVLLAAVAGLAIQQAVQQLAVALGHRPTLEEADRVAATFGPVTTRGAPMPKRSRSASFRGFFGTDDDHRDAVEPSAPSVGERPGAAGT